MASVFIKTTRLTLSMVLEARDLVKLSWFTVSINDLAQNHEQQLITDVIILDFSKAFDTVNHRKLLFLNLIINMGSTILS